MTPDRRRVLVLAAVLVVVALGYAVLARVLSQDAAIYESSFATADAGDGQRLGIYVEALSIDPVNETTRLRVSFTPDKNAPGRPTGVFDRDAKVQVGDEGGAQELVVRGERGMAIVELDLHDGTVGDYPFDRFRATLRIAARDAASPAGDVSRPMPLNVTVWERMAGWVVETTQDGDDGAGGIQLQLHIRRGGALSFLVVATYAGMVLVACASLTIGSLVFLRQRAAESTLTGALGAMLFALPALRSALPGAPPLGVRADLLVFVWAELAVALGLALFLVTWVQARNRV